MAGDVFGLYHDRPGQGVGQSAEHAPHSANRLVGGMHALGDQQRNAGAQQGENHPHVAGVDEADRHIRLHAAHGAADAAEAPGVVAEAGKDVRRWLLEREIVHVHGVMQRVVGFAALGFEAEQPHGMAACGPVVSHVDHCPSGAAFAEYRID